MKKSQIFITCMVAILGFKNIIISSDIDVATYNTIISSLQQQSLLDQFNALAAAGISGITLPQIPTIPSSVIPMITNDQIIQFTATQMPAFISAQIQALTLSQIAALASTQVAAFTSAQVGFMSPEQISVMSIGQLTPILSYLSVVQVQALTMMQIQSLPTSALIAQLANLTKTQLQYITLQQLVALDTSITSRIADLSPAQFVSLSSNQIKKMTLANPDQLTSQIAYLSVAQIGYLLPAQIAAITTAQINLMTRSQLNALLVILQNPTLTTTSNNPNLGTQLSAIAVAPGVGVPSTAPVDPVEVVAKVKAKAKARPQYVGSTLDRQTGLYKVNKDSKLADSLAKTSKDTKKLNKKIERAFKI